MSDEKASLTPPTLLSGDEEGSERHNRVVFLRDFRVLLLLFVGLRLVILAAHDPNGLMAYGEFDNFYKFADITRLTGLLPFIGYWMEYPPLFVWPNLGLHMALNVWLGLPEHTYYYTLALIVLSADVGNLILMRRLGERLYGAQGGLDIAWAYAILGVPLVFLMWNVEPVVTLFMLLGLLGLLEGKDGRSALAVAAGALIKVMPVLLIPTAWRFRSPKRAVLYTGIVAALGVGAYLPFLILSPPFALASLRAQISKSSWQTVWALLDGNFGTGNFGDLIDRLDASKATQMLGHPPLISPWVALIAFGALYAYLFTRPIRRTDRAQVAFFGVTWCVFLLWSKGWSTPWMQMVIPLILLIFPNREGVLAILLFSLVNFLEWPVLMSRGFFWGLYLTAPLRTLLIIGFLVAFWWQCRPQRVQTT